MEGHKISEVSAVVVCPTCHWMEQAETAMPDMKGFECPRCKVDGIEVVTDTDEIKALRLCYCVPCQSWHST